MRQSFHKRDKILIGSCFALVILWGFAAYQLAGSML